jgi:hypothetical protein
MRMAMAMDLGMGLGDDDGDEIRGMSDDQMVSLFADVADSRLN